MDTSPAETAFLGTPQQRTDLHYCLTIQSSVPIETYEEIEKLNSPADINPILLLHATLLHHSILFLHPNHWVLLSNSHHLLILSET